MDSTNKNLPIGVRNNNPLNIRVSSNTWQGKVKSDNSFEKFLSMDYGIRAGIKNLQTYYTRDKLKTVQAIISKWAPAVENNVENYVNRVVNTSGLSKNSILPYNAETFARLVHAMSIVELGAVYVTKEQIKSVIDQFKLF